MNGEQRPEILELKEYVPCRFDLSKISEPLGDALWRKYGSQIVVDFPSPKTEGKWQLSSQGWVGYIPCSDDLGLALRPKVSLGNLFRMLEYAYGLERFRFLEGLIDCRTLEDFYERLANVLARRVLDRARKGFYRAYLPESESLPFVRGRINVRRSIQSPCDVKIQCHYEEHTADIEENQILVWTLSRIAHSGMCTSRVLPTARRAYHALRGTTGLRPFKAKDCVARLYNRLNGDYRVLHALCRFFLEHTGPSHEIGDRKMLPFLVNMARLYELFVAKWLINHIPVGLRVKAQEKVDVGEGETLSFKIDLVLYDMETGKAICVLDTKYKVPDQPGTDDVSKVTAYAEMKNCSEAVLIYPVPLARPLTVKLGNIQVRTMTFSLKGNLEEQGSLFLNELIEKVKR